MSARGIEESQKQVTNEDSFVFPLGEKVEVGSLVFDIGGGAANVAVSLARQGLHAAYLGKLGADRAGDEICDLLTAEGVNISGAIRDPKVKTNLSTVLLAESGERSILTFRGATSHLKRSEINPSWIEGSWLYVTSLAGKLSTLEWVVKLANTKGIRIALDPGKGEMADRDRFLKLLPKIQLLKANRAELALLNGDDDLERSVMTLHEFGCDVVGTDGAQGSFAAWSDGRLHLPLASSAQAVDRTGAGDAFGSGLVGALARGKSFTQSLAFAERNATAVVAKIGGTRGLLKGRKRVERPD